MRVGVRGVGSSGDGVEGRCGRVWGRKGWGIWYLDTETLVDIEIMPLPERIDTGFPVSSDLSNSDGPALFPE